MFKVDLHLHSKYSPDSSCEVGDMLKVAARRDIQGVAITDHNRLDGNEEAQRLAREAGLLALQGMELSTQEGHILVYGVQDPVPPRLTAVETVERVREQGGLAVAAHPYRFWSGLGEDVVRRVRFGGVEALNARTIQRHNRQAERLARDLRLPMTAGSDAHRLADIGRGLLLLPGPFAADEDLLAAIRKGKGRSVGLSRGPGRTMRYGVKAVGEWMLRGFRRM
ncbi:MAG: CehA/McbA family metallohydrolase [Thermoplasmata archaeon]